MGDVVNTDLTDDPLGRACHRVRDMIRAEIAKRRADVAVWEPRPLAAADDAPALGTHRPLAVRDYGGPLYGHPRRVATARIGHRGRPS